MQSSPFNGALPLPEVPLPSDTVCYTVELPNEPRILEAFEGAIQMLSRWPYWARDDDHRGIVAANVFKDLYQSLEAGVCEVINIRIKPTDLCTLQLTTDGGLHWVDVADLRPCADLAVTDGIQQRLDDGTLSGGGQQPGQGAGNPGQCYSYPITLRGNDRWNSPVAVEGGDVITVSNASGAWSAVSPLAAWYCADGENYVLGQCAGGGVLDPGDPVPTVLHMRLIGNLPADSTTPYFDMYNLIYTVPSGVALGDFFLQANDSVLSDNQGSINLQVEICKSLWTHVFDFTIDAQGWAVEPGEAGTYVAGIGWEAAFLDAQNFEVGISISFSTIRLVDCVMTFDRTSHAGANAGYRVQGFGTTGESHIVTPGVDGTDLTLSANFTTNKTKLFCQVNNGTAAAAALIKRIVVRGTGTDPF